MGLQAGENPSAASTADHARGPVCESDDATALHAVQQLMQRSVLLGEAAELGFGPDGPVIRCLQPAVEVGDGQADRALLCFGRLVDGAVGHRGRDGVGDTTVWNEHAGLEPIGQLCIVRMPGEVEGVEHTFEQAAVVAHPVVVRARRQLGLLISASGVADLATVLLPRAPWKMENLHHRSIRNRPAVLQAHEVVALHDLDRRVADVGRVMCCVRFQAHALQSFDGAPIPIGEPLNPGARESGRPDHVVHVDVEIDLSPGSLEGMRIWLRQHYRSLDALNAEWGTHFVRWEDVRPDTTRQAMRRTDDNFAAWSDFKAWMDVAFARALRMGTDAVHEADPSALAGIEGVQIPGWGGYDYSLLVGAVDVMEPDDLPLAHSLNPQLITLTTSFGGAPKDIHAIWRNLLAGSRGLGLWDPKNAIVRDDATLGERGRAYVDTFAEIRGGIGALLLASEPQLDPVAIFYSPASFRVQWMLEQRPKGDAWMNRDSETELHSNAARDAMWAYEHAVTHLGLQPSYVASLGDLRKRGFKALILPHAIALSADDAHAVHEFAAAGGVVVADVQPGVFDSHGRRQPGPMLDPGVERRIAPDALDTASLGVSPSVTIEAAHNDVTVHTWRHGDETIIGVLRDFAPNATDETVVLNLPQPAEVYDLRMKQPLNRTGRVVLTLDAVFPALLSVSPK